MALSFKQINTHKKIKKLDDVATEQTFSYERDITIYRLNSRSEKKIYYDKELKIHFESLETYNSYEIEIQNVYLNLDREIRKSQDFLRRLNYKYDWMRVEKCSNGKITKIENLPELRSNWELLKKRLRKDFTGTVVDTYLKEISDRFSDDEHFNRIFSQYNEYGLLLLHIPERNTNDSQGKRIIYIEDDFDSKLIETVTLINENEESKTYNIKLEKEHGSLFTLLDSVGELEWNKMDNQVQAANVKITYTYDEVIINEWDFRLNRIVESSK